MRGPSLKSSIFSLLVLILGSSCLMFFQNCSPVHDRSGALSSSLTGLALDSSAKQIIQTHCASCHGGSNNVGGVTQIEDTASMIRLGHIVPGNPSGSVFFTDIENKLMPTSYSLSASDVAIMRQWVVELALAYPPPPPPGAPTCTITVDKTAVVSGQSVAVTLTIQGNATSATLNGAAVSASGTTITINPTANVTIAGQVSGAAGASSCSSPLVSVTPPAPTPPNCTISVDKTLITSGQSVIATLTVQGSATTATLNGSAVAATGGSVTLTPTANITISGQVSNAAGTKNCTSPLVTVNPPAPPGAPTCTVTANKTALTLGQSVSFTLNVQGSATSAMLNGSSVAVTGATITLSPTSSLAVSGQVSNVSGTSLCASPLVVVTAPPPAAPTCTLSSSAQNVVPGDPVNLSMTITGSATSATINGAAVTLANSQLLVMPVASATYSGSVTGTGGTTNCSVSVSTKATANLTKDEHYRAKIGPGAQSVDDLAIRCMECHSSTPRTGYATAAAYFVLVSGNSATNLTTFKRIVSPTNSALTWNLTTAAAPPNTAGTLHAFASNHKKTVRLFTFTAGELSAIQTYVLKP